MVADAQHGEAERPDRRARRGRSRAASSGSTAVPYGMREARHGRGRLVRAGQPQRRGRARAPRAFVAPASSSGWRDAVLGGRAQAGAPVAGVVGVGAGEQRRVAAACARARPARRRARSCRSSSGRAPLRAVARRARARRWRRLVGDADVARPRARAPSSSPAATAGETAVTASARSPSARAATAATTLRVDAAGERDDRAAERARRASSSSASELVTSRTSCAAASALRPDGLHRRAG